MKRLLALILCLATFLPVLPVLAEETEKSPYQYDATTLNQFYLRAEMDMNSKRVQKVPKGKVVNVIEYGEEWSLLEYKGKTGYGQSKWIFKFHSHDPFKYTIPHYERPYGIGTMKIEFNTKGMAGKTMNYGGNLLYPGDRLTVHYYDAEKDVATILVWRNYIELPAGAMDVEPFVDPVEAQPGDMVGGYTTYTSLKYGSHYAKNRRYNMKHAAELVNGAVVKAGEEFSFNSYAAPYSSGNGYRMSHITGGPGKGYGGGACQINVLTYSAALGMPFRIGEHHLHTDEGSVYALWWCDATIGNSRDMTFTNLLPYDVRFEYSYDEDGMATLLFYRDN
ncbi:MAG: VanW family protein [Clostridia bacterium]|nr:VanW family protein [Clostridia bacterium]